MVRSVGVLAAALVMAACARNKSAPRPPQATTRVVPAPPPSPPVPEQAASCDRDLVERVAAGTAPLGELWTRHCDGVDKARAILTARTKPSLTGFVTARHRGTAVVPSMFDDSWTRVSWEGTCVASVDEMLPPSNGLLPSECLSDAEVSEQEVPPELNDLRARFLFDDPTAMSRWRSCRQQAAAETCLERLLPSTGGGAEGDRVSARWIGARNHARKSAGIVRRAKCHLVLVDRDSGTLGFRCQGTLVDIACRGDDGGVTFNEVSGWCAGGKLAEVGTVNPAPPQACLESARAALRAPAEQFAAVRAAALAACAPNEWPQGRAEHFDEQALDGGSRAMVHRLLARQEALFGPLALPANGEHVVARGCGNQIWAIQETRNPGTIGNGGWGGYDHEWHLVRLPAAAKPREAEGSPVYFDDTERWGNLFHGYQNDRDEVPRTEADLVEEACLARHGNPALCSGYARGYDAFRSQSDLSAEDRAEVVALVARDWPRASLRLARWQLELARGVRLNTSDGEEVRQTCTRLLIDACTGDLGEVCTRLEADDPSCDGEMLPDGRCRQYHFVRLPLLPASAVAR